MVFKVLRQKWKNYKYRFVPWIVLNLKERKVRRVGKGQNDKFANDVSILNTLVELFEQLTDNPADVKNGKTAHEKNLTIMENVFGFRTERKKSVLPNGGIGVFVTKGHVRPGTVVSMYPGTLYNRHEPVLFQSISNPFIFRCIDGILIDGNDRNLSKFVYKSCCQRDRLGPYLTGDMSWLTEYPVNPLAVGQYVNNQSSEYPANVVYQEIDIPPNFPLHLQKFLPNIFYRPVLEEDVCRPRRVVVLISIREINEGEELFSTYFTVVH